MSTSVQAKPEPDPVASGEPNTTVASFSEATPSQASPNDEDEDDYDSDENLGPIINDIESLKQGIIKTSRNKAQGPYTILLVGETGVGKSSVLEFIANVVIGNDTDKYNFSILDHKNEAGGSTSKSQTNSARIYELMSNNGILVRILDTPGLADTRGLQQDEIHKKSIAMEIQENIESVNAVLILANGTVPRITVGTDYALSTLSAIFPKTLAQNIAFMFTNVASPLSWNFSQDSVPEILKEAPRFLLDNPIALQKKYLQLRDDPNKKKAKRDMRKAVKASELKAVETLVDLFDWLDGCQPQPTTDILSLYEKSQNIEAKIANALAQMDSATKKKEEIDKYMQALQKDSADMDAFSKFQTTVNEPIWQQQPTTTLNTLCVEADCYKNCHEGLIPGFFVHEGLIPGFFVHEGLIPGIFVHQVVRACRMIFGEKCHQCGHFLRQHHDSHFKWEQVINTQVSIDKDTKEKWERAKNGKEKKETSIAAAQEVLDKLNQDIDNATKDLAQLAEDYAGLSLSGSFSAQVQSAVRLLQQKYKGMEEKGVDKEQLQKVKESLDVMENKLEILKAAKEKVQKNIQNFQVQVWQKAKGIFRQGNEL